MRWSTCHDVVEIDSLPAASKLNPAQLTLWTKQIQTTTGMLRALVALQSHPKANTFIIYWSGSNKIATNCYVKKMYLKTDEISSDQMYFHLIQSVIPRPIAWVLTQNEIQNYNLAPFSFFNAVCSDPPLLMLSLGNKPDSSIKDTLRNIEREKSFTIHIVHGELLPALNQTAASLEYGISELDNLNLELCEFGEHPLPRIKICRVAYACELYGVHELGNQSQQHIIYGKINQCYFDDDVISQDEKGRIKLHADRLDPVARLGASEYASLGKISRLKRPA